MRTMDTKILQLTAARTELQMHLANVVRDLCMARTTQMVQAATTGVDVQLTVTIERLEDQKRALRGILELICDRLVQEEPERSLR